MTLEEWKVWLDDPKSVIAVATVAVAFLAAIAGWVSAISARGNLKTARKQLRIAEAGEVRKREPLRCSIETANSIHDGTVTHYVFRVRVTNPADSANSITAAQLRVHYDGVDGRALEAKFDPSTFVPPEWEAGTESIQIPTSLLNRQSVRAGLSYAVPDSFSRGKDIRRFSIAIVDSEERVTAPETLLVTSLKVGNETR